MSDGSGKATTKPLDEAHRVELRASGLTDETIANAGIYSAGDGAITEILGWKPKAHHWGRGWVIPFDDGYSRIKLDHPRHSADNTPIKYESPRGKGNKPYFPSGTKAAIEAGRNILLTEGEKKSLAATQAGFACIGLVGVWGWQVSRNRDDHGRAYGQRQLVAELAAIDWKRRNVYIAFDSDATQKHGVQLAIARLSEALSKAGAEARVVQIPPNGDEKVGLDDFLVHHGDGGPMQLRKLMDEAVQAELPKKWEAIDYAKALLDERFRRKDGYRLRWWRDEYWRYTGRKWKRIAESELIRQAIGWLDGKGSATPRFATEVVRCMSALVRVHYEVEMACFLGREFDLDPKNIIAASNQLLHIPVVGGQIELIDHTPLWFSPNVLDYDFDLGANCREWLAFLDQVFCGDHSRIRLLQKWFGLLLTRDTSYQKLLLMVGPKRAGKGTIARVLQRVIGPDNVTSPTLSSFGGNFGLWQLLDKSVAIMADAHIGYRADGVRVIEIIKGVTGEDAFNIDRKNLPPLLNVRLPVRFVITVNELPNLRDASGALSSRLSVLPFTESFEGQEDRELEGRLINECPGIFAWSLRGLNLLRVEGFHVPDAAYSVVENFERLSSPIIGFMQDCCESDPNYQVPCGEIFDAWREWARAGGHKASSSTRFGEQLRSAKPHIVRTRPRQGDARIYVYNSIRLNSYGKVLAEKWKDQARS